MKSAIRLGGAVMLAAAWIGVCPSAAPCLQSTAAVLPPVQVLFNISGVVNGSPAPGRRPIPLSGANISVIGRDEALLYAISNAAGWYEFSRPNGQVIVSVSKDGYATEVKTVELSKDIVLNFTLKRVGPNHRARHTSGRN